MVDKLTIPEYNLDMKMTLYNIPVNEKLIWDYEWKDEDYKTDRFFKWYLARVLSYGSKEDIRNIEFSIIKKYLDVLIGVPGRVKEFWEWYLTKYRY